MDSQENSNQENEQYNIVIQLEKPSSQQSSDPSLVGSDHNIQQADLENDLEIVNYQQQHIKLKIPNSHSKSHSQRNSNSDSQSSPNKSHSDNKQDKKQRKTKKSEIKEIQEEQFLVRVPSQSISLKNKEEQKQRPEWDMESSRISQDFFKARNPSVDYKIIKSQLSDDTELYSYIRAPDAFFSNYQSEVSRDFTTSLDRVDRGFLKNITDTGFVDKCEVAFKKVKGLFSDLSIEQIIQYSKQPISKTSLTVLGEQVMLHLHQCYNQIYLTQGKIEALENASSCARNIEQALYLLHINGNQGLTDELYLQVLKQIRFCQDYNLQRYYCYFILMLCSSYPPSSKWFYAILNYLYIGARAFEPSNIQVAVKHRLEIRLLNKGFSEILKMSFFRLMKTFVSPKRRYVPTLQEIELTIANKQIPIPIALYMQNSKWIQVESHFQIYNLKNLICKQLKIGHLSSKLGLCMVWNETQINLIDQNQLVVDVLREIELRTDEIKKKRLKDPSPYVSLKISQFFQIEQNDIISINIYFVHFVNEYLRGKMILNEEQVINLCALKCVIDFGSLQQNHQKPPFINPNNFVPVNHKRSIEVAEQILAKYKGIAQATKHESQIAFLEELMQQPLFLTWQYSCKRQINNNDFKDCVIALTPFILVLCSEKQEIVKKYALLQIISFNQSQNHIQLLIDDGNVLVFIMQDTMDAKGFSTLLRHYMDQAMIQQIGL